ncbi:MAG TPA: phytanoyl-CoA dioxygenase family protein [Bryobacteraceae bacterium]|nr:phytanoyl-CoA dioxygenase family protein [Bryobacteraceae bacterium]
MEGLDGMEGLTGRKIRPLEDSAPFVGDARQLRERADGDGFLFVRGLVPGDAVLALREVVLDYANAAGWLDPGASVSEGRAARGKRVGYYQDPDWVNLQAHVQNRPEMWALGEAVAIHAVLNAVESRSSYLCLSTANTCRVFSPHPDMATQPHQDGNYLRTIEDFWTAWIPLGDCPRELGPLALLAGSHLGGLLEHAGQGIVDGGVKVPDDSVWSTTDFRCGDVVLFRPHTLHCSLPNTSGNRLRLSVDFRYGFWNEHVAIDWRAASIRR